MIDSTGEGSSAVTSGCGSSPTAERANDTAHDTAAETAATQNPIAQPTIASNGTIASD